MAVGSSPLPWAHIQLAAILGPVKGLVGLARDGVCSRDARSPFDPPIPRPDTVAPSAEPRRGDGGDDEPAGSIGRPPTGGKNVRLSAGGIAVAVPSVVRQRPPKPRRRSPRPRTRHARVRRRGARVSAQPRPPGFFLLRSSRVRRALRPVPAQSLPAVLQPLLPSGVASGDRAGTALADSEPVELRSATAARPLPRALSWLARYRPRPRAAHRISLPPEGGRGGRVPGPLRAPRSLSPILPTRRQGDESVPRRSGRVPCALDELGDHFRRYRLRVPQAVQAMAQSLRRWGQCAPIVATLREETTAGARWLHPLGGGATGARHDHAVGAADRTRRPPRQGGDLRAEPDGSAAVRAGRSMDRSGAGA